ncbi:MAG TPA: chemotaxis protein CheW [Planctomycetaceae bacterium]|nr:chemotaxis protein CheW [Planctomycetaceae bacterium]
MTAVDDIAQLTELSTDGNQFLTFTLQEEEFGIEILRVQEIKGLARITPIPNMPNYIRGVMNLRGTVVPIVDLRARFSMPEASYNQFTVIIVVTIGEKVTGLVVDAVSDVLNVSDENIEPPPDMGSGSDTAFMAGIAKSGERLITLLNMEELVSFDPS